MKTLPTLVIAACFGMSMLPAQAKVVFQCKNINGKQIQVQDLGKTLRYSFGKPGHPEIVVNVPREQARRHPWGGTGAFISDDLDIPNGDIVYSVNFSVNRMSDQHEIEAGVTVYKAGSGETLARIPCNRRGKIFSQLSELDNIPQADN